jgi:signal transduction histidine kinase
MDIREDVADFNQHILASFLVLGVGLTVAVIVQVVLALKPLKAVRAAIADVKSGNSSRVQGDFPRDLEPLVDELNFLIDHNEVLLRRARNQLGDLAHAVKNPLTVIRNEARGMTNPQGQLILDQSHVMANSIDHALSRARMHGQRDAMGYRTSVREVIEDLAYAMDHIHRDRKIDIDLSGISNCWFRGEAQDLEEMAGNLLDNACKWAEAQVRVSCSTTDRRLHIMVDDDGPGIPESHRNEVMNLGRRLDESKKRPRPRTQHRA